MHANDTSDRPAPVSPRLRHDRGPRLAGCWRVASAALRAGWNRLEPTVAGRVWKQLSELDVINSSLRFAALFTLGFIPFLMLLSAALGSDLPAIIIQGTFKAKAARDLGMLFTHGPTAPTGLPVPGLILAVIGGAAISQMLQTWYTTIFRAHVHRWTAMVRRARWLAGVFGYVALQVVISRGIQPHTGPIVVASVQFLLALVFWWWSLHTLLAGQIPWRRLFPAGLATAVCYIGLGIYITYVMSSTIVTNESTYGPIGAVITLLTAEIGLAVTLQLGAAIGASLGPGRSPDGRPPDTFQASANGV